MRIVLSRDIYKNIIEEAERASPHEACGILFGQGFEITAIQPTRNVHPDPATHFEIDPSALIAAYKAAREGGPVIAGYYHSHPSGPPEPSGTDREMAANDGKVWAIIGHGEIRFWRSKLGGFEPLSHAHSAD